MFFSLIQDEPKGNMKNFCRCNVFNPDGIIGRDSLESYETGFIIGSFE